MSASWSSGIVEPAGMIPEEPSGRLRPQLVEPSPRVHVNRIARRAGSFVPEWSHRPGDAGDVMMRLFGSQLHPLLARVNRLPEKTFVEFLRLAGVQQLAGGAAATLLTFEATSGAPQSTLVPRHFQVGAQPADGSQGLVVFETTRDLYVAPGSIAEARIQEGRAFLSIEDPAAGEPFRPFGDRAIAGRGFLVGIESEVPPGPTLSLGFALAAPATPPPASAGGVQPTRVALAPVLQWEVLEGASFGPVEVIVDETSGFTTNGVVELRLPSDWGPGTPAGVDADELLYWIRVRIVHGTFAEPPELSRVMLNAVRAEAVETIRNETLEHVPGTEDRMRLARTPVVPGSLVLEVLEGGATSDLLELDDGEDESPSTASGVRRWTEVSDLSRYGPDDRVFTLDPLVGEITFGDGHHGMALPRGFRHVEAVSYRVGGGARGAVDADAIKTLIHSAPFIRGATNPMPASDGTDMESRDRAVLRGPDEIRTRGRAVTERDYELLACRAPGASVARARAVSGLHPLISGAPIPGVVGVFLVPAGHSDGVPVASDQALRAVAEYLAGEVAPAGVEVVAAAARFHRIRVEVRVQVADTAADVGETVRGVIKELNAYFDPITGGDEGVGWPFGGSVRYMPLLRRLLARVPSASAIPRLNLVVDGARFPSCTDVQIPAYGLLWPEAHEVTVEAAEDPA